MSKRNMGTWPEKWGFIPDLSECVGKTIAEVCGVKMPWGCTWSSAIAVRFSDGTRAFFVGGVGSGIVSPELEAVTGCPIFTPDEVGQYAAAEAARARQQERDRMDQKRRALADLKKELGEGAAQ